MIYLFEYGDNGFMTKIFLEKTKLPIKLFTKIIRIEELPRLPVIFYIQ